MDWSQVRQSLLGPGKKSIVPPRVKLPILPIAVTKFTQEANKQETSARELGKIVESDSGLTCELLRQVNSCARGMSQKASSAAQAISLLGIRESHLFLTTKAVVRAMRGRESKLINLRDFWNTNLERALLAREVAALLRADVETAFAAAMLQDFLLPALTNDLFPKYLDFAQPKTDEPVSLVKYEKQAHGWNHAEAAARIMLDWDFPDELVCCVFLHHRGLGLLGDKQFGRTAATAVAVSALIPDAIRQIPTGLDQLVQLDQKWKAFDLIKIAEKVDAEFQEMSAGASNPFSLLRRCKKALSGAR
jgi:serine/threonine-protein kinase